MRIRYGRIPLLGLPLLLFSLFTCLATERVFILKNEGEIVQYKIRDSQDEVTQVATYGDQDFPGIFPASSIAMKRGNILSVYDQARHLKGRLVYDPDADRLKLYDGNPGDRAGLSGRLLEDPNLDELFRQRSHMYFKDWNSAPRREPLRDKFGKMTGSTYRDVFVLQGRVFGISGDHVYQLTDKKGESLMDGPRTALVLSGGDLTAAAESPWGEVFIADAAQNQLHRVFLRDGELVAENPVKNPTLKSPSGLDFTASGELFVANGMANPHAVSRLKFNLGGFTRWWPRAKKGLDLDGSGALDVAVAEPVGYVISEKTHPIQQLGAEAAGGHYGISQVMFLGPESNSEASIIALVQYAPGETLLSITIRIWSRSKSCWRGKRCGRWANLSAKSAPEMSSSLPDSSSTDTRCWGTSPSSFCSWSGGTSRTSLFKTIEIYPQRPKRVIHEGPRRTTKGH